MLPAKRDSSEFVPGHGGSFSLSVGNLGNHDDSNTRSAANAIHQGERSVVSPVN